MRRPNLLRLTLAAALFLAGCGAVQTPSATSTLRPVQVTTVRLPAQAASASATLASSPTVQPASTPTPPPPTEAPPPTSTPRPLPTPDGQAASRQARLPILMYHYVEPWPADADEIRRNLTVRPEDFAAQMQYLHDRGYVTVSLYDLIDALALGAPLPARAVVLTFDDGYRSLVDYAVPILQPYGYTGTVFVITELMDREFEQYLTWPQAEALYAQGWSVEPHTKTHAELKGRDRDFQLYQMLGSVQTVEAHIGVQPRFLNYPAGKYDELSIQLAKEMNLWGAVTVEFGRVHTLAERYTLGRVRIGGQMTLAEFAAVMGEPGAASAREAGTAAGGH